MSGIATDTDKEVSWLSLVAKARTKNNHQWSGLLVAEQGRGGGADSNLLNLCRESPHCLDEQEF